MGDNFHLPTSSVALSSVLVYLLQSALSGPPNLGILVLEQAGKSWNGRPGLDPQVPQGGGGGLARPPILVLKQFNQEWDGGLGLGSDLGQGLGGSAEPANFES